MANVLILCERSGAIRNAFGRLGHNVLSVDTLPSTTESEGNSKHIVADASRLLDPNDDLHTGWDLIISRPPCTYLTNSGVRWLFEKDADGELTQRAIERWHSLVEAIAFFNLQRTGETAFHAIENPIPHRYARLGIKAGLDEAAAGTEKERAGAALVRRSLPASVTESTEAIGAPTQVVQPWMFGHPESKGTGWWLKGLPELRPTDDVKVHMMTLPASERNRVHHASPGPDRWMKRSLLVEGMAVAMADQWGSFVDSQLDRSSPASTQAYIETGRYNTYAETGEYAMVLS